MHSRCVIDVKRLVHAVFLVAVLGCIGCNEKLIHDLSEHDANRVVSRLHKDGITGSKVQQADGRWSIEVAKNDTVRALLVVDSSRVLSRKKSGDTRGRSMSILPTREEQWFQYETQVAEALEVTLLTLPGVVDAHVHLHLPPSDPLLGVRDKGGGTGSVLLITESQSSIQDDEVAKMIAGGAGIPPEQVRVLRSVAVNASLDVNETSYPPSSSLIGAEKGNGPENRDLINTFSTPNLFLTGMGIGLLSVFGVIGYLLFKSARRRREIFILPSNESLTTHVGT